MKKLLSLLSVSLLCAGAFAQDSTGLHNNNNTSAGKDSFPSAGKDSMQMNGNNGSSNQTQGMNGQNSGNGNNTTMGSTKDQAHMADSSTKNNSSPSASSGNNNQGSSTTSGDSAATKPMTDRVIMREDKMYIVKGGESTLLDKSYKLESGAVVTTGGSVKYPSGKTVQLKNGQFIELKPKATTTAAKTIDTKKTTTKTAVKKKTAGNG